MKEKTFITIFVIGILLTIAVGIFSLFMEARMPSGYLQTVEEYHDIALLSSLSRQLLEFRREGLTYLILHQQADLTDFQRSEKLLLETLQMVANERVGLGDPALVEAVLTDIGSYIHNLRQVVADAQLLETEMVFQRVRSLISSDQIDSILDKIVQLDTQNYLAYTRLSSEVSEAAKYTLLVVAIFEITAIGIIVFSAIMLLRVYASNKELLIAEGKLKDQLNEKNQELESFIRIVGHDLRAPLLNIKGFTDEIIEHNRQLNTLRGALPLSQDQASKMEAIIQKDMPQALCYIAASAETLSDLIKGMITVAKVGQLPLHPVVIDINALFSDIFKDFDFRLKEAGTHVHIEQLPHCIADRNQIRQVFSNVIDNAIKYRQPSQPLEIHVSGYAHGEQSVYCVKDNGIGIAADEIGSIFNLYHQLQRKNMTGDGIGLATVKRMVEHNGGSVDVQSQPGQGSRFYIRLPVAQERT